MVTRTSSARKASNVVPCYHGISPVQATGRGSKGAWCQPGRTTTEPDLKPKRFAGHRFPHDLRARRSDLRRRVRGHPGLAAPRADRARSDPLRRERLRVDLVPPGLPDDGRAAGRRGDPHRSRAGPRDRRAVPWLALRLRPRPTPHLGVHDRSRTGGLRSLSRTGRIHILLAGTAFASIAIAASHLDWTGRPDALGPLGWVVMATAIATGTAIVVAPIRRVALGVIERTHYAFAIIWLIVVSASII